MNFKQYITEQKNTHMTHIEDLVLDGGVDGTRSAINALRSLRDMLAGVADASRVTVKWDGAPAVFAGIDPSDGSFFVAKKGIFNANPKVYKSHADIDADIPNPDLNSKMKIAYTELSKLGIKGVVQGDIMFTQDDLKVEKIKGEEYVTFHPNTILYAIPSSSPQAKVIQSAKIGVVFHTSYTGKSFETMKASYGVKVSALRKIKTVWAVSADLPNAIGALMTADETAEVTAALSTAGKIFNRTSAGILKELQTNKELNDLVNIYNNQKVRARQAITNTATHARGFKSFIVQRYDAEIAKKKTPAGKKVWEDRKNNLMAIFKTYSIRDFKSVFDLQNAIVSAKLIIINKLNRLSNVDTFVKTKHGFRVTGSEGFVAIDKLGGSAVKLVDRLEFSANNFSDDVIKGWDTPRRG